MSDRFERSEEQADRNRRRAYNCGKCGAPWALRAALGKDLPPSAQDGVFAAMKYDYCSACGNTRMKSS